MDDTHNNRATDTTSNRKRRSSILKSQRATRTPFSELEFNVTTPTDTAKSRRVSFSRKTVVAEFITDEATTTRKNVYEEYNKSLESSKDDSDIKTQGPPIAHLGKRIFDNQFEEVEAIDYIETVTPTMSTSLNLQDITSVPTNDLCAPQCNYELTALTDQQSKLFGNEFTITGVAEMSGRIEVNFSAIERINDNDDLAEIEKYFGRASNVICHAQSDNHDSSEYIEVDLNATNAGKNDVCDMSITDTIKSPKMQNVSKNCSNKKKKNQNVDWASDKENIVINPYAAPIETDNFAVNENNGKVLVYDGKRLTLESENTDKEYRGMLLPISSDPTPQRKTIVLNTDDDLPNFVPSETATSVEIGDELPSIEPVNKIEIVSKNTVKNSCNLSVADNLVNCVLYSGADKRQTTMMYEAEDANISMTQALPAKIITETLKTSDRRRTIIYEQDAVNLSLTQALSSNILLEEKNYDKMPSNPKTLVLDNEGNPSISQPFLNVEKDTSRSRSKTTYDDNNFDLSITEAVPAGIVIDQVPELADQRQMTVCKDDAEDISFTKALPSNILLGKVKQGKESMTEILPNNIIFKHRDLTRTIVFEDDQGNISITAGICGKFSDFDDSKNKNDKSRTITFKDSFVDLVEAESLNPRLIPSQIVPISNSNDDNMRAQEQIHSCKTLVESGLKQSVLDKKPKKVSVKENKLNEKGKKESRSVKEIGTDKKEKVIDKEEIKIDKIENIGKKEISAGSTGILPINQNEILEMPNTENVNVVETIVKNIKNSQFLNSIELSKSENKKTTPKQKNDNSQQEKRLRHIKEKVESELSPAVIKNIFGGERSIEDIKNDLSNKLDRGSGSNQYVLLEIEAYIDAGLGINLELNRPEDIIENLVDRLSIKDAMLSPGDLIGVKDNKMHSPGYQRSLKKSILKNQNEGPKYNVMLYQTYTENDQVEDIQMRDDRSIAEHSTVTENLGHQLSLNVTNPDNPNDETSIKDKLERELRTEDERSIEEDIKDNLGNKLGIKKDSEQFVLLEMEAYVDDSSGIDLELNVPEDIIDNLGDQVDVNKIKAGSPYSERSVKLDMKDSPRVEHINKEDINDNLGDEMSTREYSKDRPPNEIMDNIHEHGNELSIERIISDPAKVSFEGVASDQTIFRCVENLSNPGSTICLSENVGNINPVQISNSELNTESSGDVKSLVLDVLLAVPSTVIDTSDTVEGNESGNSIQERNVSGDSIQERNESINYIQDEDKESIPSHESSYLIIDTNTQTDSQKSISNLSEKENVNTKIAKQFSSEIEQCDQEIQTDRTQGSMFTDTFGIVPQTKEKPDEQFERNLNIKIQSVNNTRELLNMISDFTEITRSESHAETEVLCPQAVINGAFPMGEKLDNLSRKRLSFTRTRHSVGFNREDLLNNISMAQAALQKSHIEIEDSINAPSPNDSDIKNNPSIDIEVVKTLNFDDESFSCPSSKSDHSKTIHTPLKKPNFRDNDMQNDTNKSVVIPTYLKDVSDSIKELMADLVKPMTDSLPFDSAGESSRVERNISTTSIQLQTNLLQSSQIDINDNDRFITQLHQQCDLPKLVDTEHFEDAPPCIVDKDSDPVIIFDDKNPLNNILLRPLRDADAHRYSPTKVRYDLEYTSEDTLKAHSILSDNNESKGTTRSIKESSSSNKSVDFNNDCCNPYVLSTSLSNRSRVSNVKLVKNSEINTNIAMKSNKHDIMKVKQIVKESEVNTNIVMTTNEDLLRTSSSLTIVDPEEGKPTLYSNEDVSVKWKEDTFINQSSTLVGKKRHYSPGTPRKSSIKKRNDNPSPCMKSKKLSYILIDNNDDEINLKPEKDVGTENSKISSDVTIQQLRVEYMNNTKKLLSKPIDSISQPNSVKSEVSESSTGLIPSSILPSSSYFMNLDNVSSFTSSKNLHTKSNPNCTPSTIHKSQTQSKGSKQDWSSSFDNSMTANDSDSTVNIVAKIDMLPFMGSYECEWESSAVDTWCFRLLHGRIRLTIKMAHRHSNVTRTLVRADTPVTDMVVETVQYEKKNSVAILCVRFASETMRFIVSRAASRPCFARDVPQLLRRCAAVARVAVRWGRAMHDAKSHLAYTLGNDGHLALKVANIPLRSVWDVSMDLELVVDGAGEIPWPRASVVRVVRVVSDVIVGERDVRRALQATPRDWGHVPRTLWRIFRFLKQKTRDDEMLLGSIPTHEIKPQRSAIKENCEA